MAVLNITNIGKSKVTILAITYFDSAVNVTGSYEGNVIQLVTPNQTATYTWYSPPEFSSITVYYQAADQTFYHTLNNPPQG
jgi:hypothetical protein